MKQNITIFVFVLLAIVASTPANAYNLNIDVNRGVAQYSSPAILGDNEDGEDEKEDHSDEDSKTQEENKKVEEKVKKEEMSTVAKVEKPEKIEIKKIENKTQVTLKKKNEVNKVVKPENVVLKFSSAPTFTFSQTSKVEDVGKTEVESEIEDEKENENDSSDDVIKERQSRAGEKVEIQSEVHDDGTVELQVESRNVKAKIKSKEIEIDVTTNNVGSTDSLGNQINLIHLPDQAMQKFYDLGVSTSPDTLEIGKSGNSFEYTIDSVKVQKLFGLIPRQEKFKLVLNDSTGTVEEKSQANNIIEGILNFLSF